MQYKKKAHFFYWTWEKKHTTVALYIKEIPLGGHNRPSTILK